MKKIIAILMATLMVFALAACGKNNAETPDENNTNQIQNEEAQNNGENTNAADGSEAETDETENGTASTEGAVGVLSSIWNAFADDQKFAAGGGNMNEPVMDAPGKFDITLTEDLDYHLGLPAEQAANIDDAASLIHMMNANMFTGAAYHLTEGTDATEFANAYKAHLANRQWLCGSLEQIIAIEYNGYVITAFGSQMNIESLKTAALTLDGAKVIFEEAIAV